jgi:AraC-like DNA-binding protein
MLDKTVHVTTEHLELREVRCRSQHSGWSPPEEAKANTLVLVREGSFRRQVRGVEALLDPAAAYFTRPGEEQRFEHNRPHGDVCTVVQIGDDLLAGIWGGEPRLPEGPLFTRPQIDLAHRRLLAAARLTDQHEATEQALSLVAALLDNTDPARVAAGRPATLSRQRRLIAAAREAITADPTTGLVALAGQLAVSPHHLSRIFRAHTGSTVSRYRNRIRVRLALERLAEGQPDLAALAADLGFADHAHLTRTVQAELGAPPSRIRATLGGGSRP